MDMVALLEFWMTCITIGVQEWTTDVYYIDLNIGLFVIIYIYIYYIIYIHSMYSMYVYKYIYVCV